ncbi:MAG: hypothetical protein OXC01_07845 [Immundisolibacterales bacterium]|nr:hypothetical protein [Immundisolibacterales bacterium]
MRPESNVVRLDGANAELRDRFLRWQCRVRQIAMRRHEGRPTSGMTPVVATGDEPVARIVTVLCKLPEHSVTMELRHLARRTHDPAERRESALKLFAERHYQAAKEFSDRLTACFPPDSATAGRLAAARECRLDFEQFGQRFRVQCTVRRLSEHNPLREATFWHNLLFNPMLTADSIILGFEPDWGRSEAEG